MMVQYWPTFDGSVVPKPPGGLIGTGGLTTGFGAAGATTFLVVVVTGFLVVVAGLGAGLAAVAAGAGTTTGGSGIRVTGAFEATMIGALAGAMLGEVAGVNGTSLALASPLRLTTVATRAATTATKPVILTGVTGRVFTWSSLDGSALSLAILRL